MGHLDIWTGGSGTLSQASAWLDADAGALALAAPGAADTAVLGGSPTGTVLAAGALDVGALVTFGTVALTGTVTAGAALAAGALAVAAGATLQAATGVVVGTVAAQGAGASVQVAGTLTLSGSAAAAGGGTIAAGALVLDGGTLAVDALSGARIGSFTAAAAAGTLAVAADGAISGYGAVQAGAGGIALAGSILASGGALALFGAAGGSGTLAIAAGATLFAAGGLGAGLTVDFAPPVSGAGGTLELFGLAAACAATLAGFALGDAIDIASATVSSATWAAGVLTLTGGSGGTLRLALPDTPGESYDGATFVPLPDGFGGTKVSLIPPGQTVSSGNYVLTVPAGASELIVGDFVAVTRIAIGGLLAAEQNTETNLLELSGTLAAIGTAGLFYAPTANIAGGLLVAVGHGADAWVDGGVYLAGTLAAIGGGWTNVFTIDLAGGVVTVDPTSFLTLGRAPTLAGTIAVPAGNTLSGWGRLASPLADSGDVRAQGGALLLLGAVGGSGTLGIAAGATLFPTGAVGAGLTAAFAPTQAGTGGTLVLSGITAAFGASIAGFATGDVLDIASATISAATWAAGVLTLSGGSGALRLALPDTSGQSYDHAVFVPLPDGFGGTKVLLIPPGQTVTGGNYVLTVPAGASELIVGGVVPVSAMSVAGLLAVEQNTETNRLDLSGTLAAVGTAGLFYAPTATVAGGLLAAIGSGAQAVVSGSMQLAGTLAAIGGGRTNVGSLTLAGGVVTVDASSRLSLGTVAGEAGSIVVPAGVTLSGWGRLASPADNSGIVLAAGGALTLAGPVGGSGGIVIGAGATLTDLAPLAQGVSFAAGATLALLGGLGLVGGTLAGFAAGDAIDVAGAAIDSASWSAGTLTLSGGGGTLGTLAVAGSYAGLPWAAQPDGTGGTAITLVPDAAAGPFVELVPCFAAGTRIATPRGGVAVEALRPGDMVLTADGGVPLRWVGRRRCDTAAAAELRPVRLAAGALRPLLGAALPERDLRLSPQHALLLCHVLVPVVALVGTPGIVRESGGPIDYHHLGLDRHATVLAEGVPAETFLPVAAAAGFDAEWGARPDAGPFCAPRVEGGAALAALRRALRRRPLVARVRTPGALRGWLERFEHLAAATRLEGWACDDAAPARPVALTVFAGGRALGVALANRWRPDLDRAGLADGRCGFVIDLPARPGPLVLRRRTDGAILGVLADRP